MPNKIKKYQLDNILAGKSLDGHVLAPDAKVKVHDVMLYLAYNAVACAVDESFGRPVND